MNVRLKLVAKQINAGKDEGLLAATPPPQSLRPLPMSAVTGKMFKVLMLNDIMNGE